MTFTWLIILVLYGVVVSWENIHILMWLLLIPMMIQDEHDGRVRSRLNKLFRRM